MTPSEKITKILEKLTPEEVYNEYLKVKEYTSKRLDEQKTKLDTLTRDLDGKIENL